MSNDSIRIGISACLLGEAVRYDGGHKRDAYIVSTLGRYFEWVPVCPEVAIGLGIPREPIRLVATERDPRAVGVRNAGWDVTARLATFAADTVARLADISGYIFKSQSPSCGMERVKVHGAKGPPRKEGRGVFARVLMDSMPWLPVEEEGRLGDPVLRENFIERIFVLHRWQTMAERGLTPAGLVHFHSRHKLLVMAHSQRGYRRLGRLVAQAGALPHGDLTQRYLAELMAVLTRPAAPRSHTNILQHLMGYLKNSLDAADKAELLDCLDAYRLGQLPLIVPITLLKHHFRRHPDPYVANQYYLEPHPRELALRYRL